MHSLDYFLFREEIKNVIFEKLLFKNRAFCSYQKKKRFTINFGRHSLGNCVPMRDNIGKEEFGLVIRLDTCLSVPNIFSNSCIKEFYLKKNIFFKCWYVSVYIRFSPRSGTVYITCNPENY